MITGTLIGFGLISSLLLTAFIVGAVIVVRSIINNDESPKPFMAGLFMTMFSGTLLTVVIHAYIIGIIQRIS